jgi:Protein of unknown function (DUF4019)
MNARILVVLFACAGLSLASAQPASPPAPTPGSPPAAVPPPTEPAPVQPTMGDDRDTILASEKWLALLDSGKIGAAWDVASAHLKSVVTRQKWVEGISAARKPFGKLDRRQAEKFARSHQLPGVPEGDFSIIEFQSVFANGKQATEQLVWSLEKGDTWRVAGYYIR